MGQRTQGMVLFALSAVLGVWVFLTGGLLTAGQAPAPEKKTAANRLARESSPYLLQHAHNPVDWFPWGTEAFARAKKEGKLVFLSIGYSSCHWCHVMERESFENGDVAKLLNDWFVCIKVDREERPDVDSIYMTALNLTEERGGWPLSMFLTAEGKPIFGGTYWPPEDKVIQGRRIPGFKTVLKTVHKLQTEKAKALTDQADRLAEATQTTLASQALGKALIDLNQDLVNQAVASVKADFDPQYGGFGSPAQRFRGTKFPVPSYLDLLLHEARRTKSSELTNIITFTLDHMARGGIYDQVGGGFHRYSTERTWTVPHFEKMLYDNAQLAEVYAQAYRLTQNAQYRRVVEQTLGFVSREMTSPEGAFYSALDADSSGGEGLFYVWTNEELAAALPDKADLEFVKKVYGAGAEPNFEPQHHILLWAKSLGTTARDLKMTEEQVLARLEPLRQKLFAVRAQRPRPFLDTKILTGWNGEMIAGYAMAGQSLGEKKYIDTATKAADFVLKNLRNPEGRLARTYGSRPGQGGEARLNGYLDDYAYLAHGLLCLHDATGDRRWLDEAKAVTDTMVRFHGDAEAGGFFYTSSDHEKLFARAKDQYDGAQPSGNSMAARNLVRLWKKTGDDRYRALAEKTLKAFAAPLKANSTALTALAGAVALYVDGQGAADVVAKKEPLAQGGGAQKSDSVVKITATADPEKPGADGKQVVTVTIKIDAGWHLYANPVGNEDLATNQTVLTVESKPKPEEVKVEYPEGKEINDAVVGKYKIYEDKATLKATVKRAAGDTGPLELALKFQACNDKTCLLPATKKVTVP